MIDRFRAEVKRNLMQITAESVYNILHKSRTIAYFVCTFTIAHKVEKFFIQ